MKKYLASIIFILTAIKIIAQENSVINLNQILAQVDTTYPELLMYQNKVKSAEVLTEGAKGWMPPTFSAGMDRFPYNLENAKMKDDPMNEAGYMFSLEQMIPNPGKLKAKKNYLNSLSTLQKNNASWQRNTIHTEIKKLYYNRIITERKLSIIKESLSIIDLFIKTNEEKYVYNQSDINTIYKAKAERENLVNMQTMLQSAITESNIGINTFLNRNIHTEFAIDTSLVFPEVISADDTSFMKRSNLAVIDNSVMSMKYNQEYMSTARKPDFGVKFSHAQMLGMPNEFSLMGMVSIPIVPWSSKMYKSEVKSMDFEIASMQQEKESMILMAKRMIAEKVAMIESEKKQVQNYERNILPAFKKNLETSITAYKQNTGNFFYLLDAWKMYQMQQMEYFDRYQSLLNLNAELEFELEKN